jgi:hypothetical protein
LLYYLTNGGRNSYTLSVKLEVKKKSSYVLVEVPIPAGFVADKVPAANFYFTHEQFKEKTALYIPMLNPGIYTVSIPVYAQFTGIFVQNPSSICPMYFPENIARSPMGKVIIK